MALDVKELQQLGAGELIDKEKQLVQELFNLRFQFGTGRLENPMQIRKTKTYALDYTLVWGNLITP